MDELIYIDYDSIDLVIGFTVEENGVLQSWTNPNITLGAESELCLEVLFKSGEKTLIYGEGARKVLHHYVDRNQ